MTKKDDYNSTIAVTLITVVFH